MKTVYIKTLDDIFNDSNLSLMLGNFDGFHRGHQKLLEELLKLNTKKGMLTFYPHPLKVLKNIDFKYLDLVSDKERILENKLDYLIVLNTSVDLLNSSKEEFINFLKKNNVSQIVCGNDFTFGEHKSGTVRDLNSFDLHIVPDYKIEGKRVSSTEIREELRNGNVERASLLLGHPYSIRGIVSKGNQLGRTINFPTANIEENEYLFPLNGVYFGYAKIDDKKYYGMINIGVNPTFNLLNKRRLEINIFNFSQNIYNREIEVGFLKFLRKEKKFSSKEELILELKRNKEESIKLSKLM